jgi:hypothetical protein
MLLNPDLDSRDKLRPRPEDNRKESLRFFGLALALGIERQVGTAPGILVVLAALSIGIITVLVLTGTILLVRARLSRFRHS